MYVYDIISMIPLSSAKLHNRLPYIWSETLIKMNLIPKY